MQGLKPNITYFYSKFPSERFLCCRSVLPCSGIIRSYLYFLVFAPPIR